jgi:hypothetical protein
VRGSEDSRIDLKNRIADVERGQIPQYMLVTLVKIDTVSVLLMGLGPSATSHVLVMALGVRLRSGWVRSFLSGFGNWPTNAGSAIAWSRPGPDRFGAARHTRAGYGRTRGQWDREERGSGTAQPTLGFDAEIIGEFGPEILRHAAGR